MIRFIFFITIVFCVSCGSTVTIDYETGTDFSNYKSYGYYPSIQSGLSELDDRRITKFVDSLMPLKGFVLEESSSLYVNFYAREILSSSRNSIGIGIGGGGGNVGIGVSGGIPIGGNEVEQQLTIDIIDVSTDQLIWQAVLNGRYKEGSTRDQKDGYYQKAIAKLLKNFPPK